jgi:hypothetical protein
MAHMAGSPSRHHNSIWGIKVYGQNVSGYCKRDNRSLIWCSQFA